MNNPFLGVCEGSVLALGALVSAIEDHEYVRHEMSGDLLKIDMLRLMRAVVLQLWIRIDK